MPTEGEEQWLSKTSSGVLLICIQGKLVTGERDTNEKKENFTRRMKRIKMKQTMHIRGSNQWEKKTYSIQASETCSRIYLVSSWLAERKLNEQEQDLNEEARGITK